MKRTQIQLDEEMWAVLRQRAFQQKCSTASIIRQMLQEQISSAPQKRRSTLSTFSFVGSGKSIGKGSGTISQRHDEELAEAFSQ